MARAGLILAGCGLLDGSDPIEVLCALMALDRVGVEAICFAPHEQQSAVMNHFTGQISQGEIRNMVFESARLSLGPVRDIATAKGEDLDMLLVPGGEGVIANLTTFRQNGAECRVNPEAERVLKEAYKFKKPIGAVGKASLLVAAAFRKAANIQLKLTMGEDAEAANQFRLMGARHQATEPGGICVDIPDRVVSTPGRLSTGKISIIEKAMARLVEELLALM